MTNFNETVIPKGDYNPIASKGGRRRTRRRHKIRRIKRSRRTRKHH